MEEKVFNRGMIKLTTLLNKNIAEEELPIFYEELKFIPDDAWPEICEKAANTWDSWPRNFVKGIKFFWFDWQKGHKAQVDFQNCEFCQETGVLDFEKPGEIHQVSCFCGHCNNYLRHVKTLEFWIVTDGRNVKQRHLRLTIDEIADRGWTWDAPPPPATREDAIAAYKVMMEKIDERGRQVKLEKYQQAMFDQERQPHDDDFLEKLRR